jgi:hypothetical protein
LTARPLFIENASLVGGRCHPVFLTWPSLRESRLAVPAGRDTGCSPNGRTSSFGPWGNDAF